MCGRFALYKDSESLQHHFALASPPEVIVSYNISPQRMILAIINEQASPARVYLKWGLVTHWSQQSKTDFKMINARIEGVWQRQAFKSAIRYRRCLVPASGFFK